MTSDEKIKDIKQALDDFDQKFGQVSLWAEAKEKLPLAMDVIRDIRRILKQPST